MLTIKELDNFNQDQECHLNEKELNTLGGLMSLEKSLETNFVSGISGSESDLQRRRELYGRNEFPEPERTTWLQMFIKSFDDTTLIILIVAAIVSLAVGLYENPSTGWIEGSAILFAVLLVALVTATNDYRKESQFRKLNAQKDDIEIGVIRGGVSININVHDLVVGDIVRLNAGDKVPSDGLLVDGSDVTCNESALTGESDDKEKGMGAGSDMFMLSGANISTGYCRMLATAVGEQSRWGKTKAKLAAESVDTPLQEKLDVLANQIGNVGIGAAVCTFIAMVAIWLIYPETREEGKSLFDYCLKAFIMGVTIVVVAVPEGLPLAVTLSLAYSTQKMMADNNLIRVLAACETMGNATNICSDKTGTLTQNKMTVVEGWVGGKYKNEAPGKEDISAECMDVLCKAISVNSTAVLINNSSSHETIVSGSKTEGALLMMLLTSFNVDYAPIRASSFNASRGDRLFTFSSARKKMSVLMINGVKKNSGVSYTKGAAEVIVACSTRYVNSEGKVKPLTPAVKAELLAAIDEMAKKALRTVALAHRELIDIDGTETAEELENDLTIDAVFGIKDPLRPDVSQAIITCQAAGIFVRMVTGDNLETAKAIAKECGILTEGGVSMEGPAFRKLTPAQLDTIIPTLQVLARSSPEDKHLLVCRLNGHSLPDSEESWLLAHPGCKWSDRDLLLPGYLQEWSAVRASAGGVGEVVGVTGDGTNDGPALKAADVGLSMGLSGTDVAKEASDIVILDDNFSSIVKSVMWGRAVFDNIRKFLQFQLTVNAVALTLTFVTALTGKEPPLNAVMMLWVNLIMDTMGALALGTEPPSSELLSRKPYKRNASLISNIMVRNILVQFLFQLLVLAYLLTEGASAFGVTPNGAQHFTIVFNTFVFCQIFNEINARNIGNEMNVFRGLVSNPIFMAIIIFTVIAQYGLVEFGGGFVRTVHLDPSHWYKCILLGALSLPVGGLMRLIPCQDSKTDFAAVSPIIKTPVVVKTATSSDSLSSPSFLLW
eukprot:CAMPEP_0119037592 /NCGR_PEP_ID=MMETSP1177-20130426/6038_1 /TAXON_ID=2985 /ORGANISM="Ochromonas sp, Strain CCMP1899" /LENGTH=1002 /DNA_ID=CAMNT_0006999077 /DNA_START=43 /DNA_END=3048 /DNA_ORIENTATION=-